MSEIKSSVSEYMESDLQNPLFINGDSLDVLKEIPSKSVDCIITSPPYWNQREYDNGGIGLEDSFSHFIENFLKITEELRRVLKATGSFWLNIGDTYQGKSLVGIPWRIAISMMDNQQWILRNSVIWNKQKGGMDSSKDRLRNIHENFFHFVINKKYYYDDKKIRSKPRKAIKKNGSMISATGVSGVRYKRQIELSTSLSGTEKENALKSLEEVLDKIRSGKLSDFRMIIRNQQRTTHSNSVKVSGRAKELRDKGFYFLFYNKHGTLPSDVWEIIPEDTQRRKKHFAPFPKDLCQLPILATCPSDGVVLDPFCGTGTANQVSFELGRKSIGIDISDEYLIIAKERVNGQQSLGVI